MGKMVARWSALARETFDSLGRDDVTGLYHVEWRRAADELVAEHRRELEAEPSRCKRFLLKTNAVLYGLLKRLAPARRLLLAVALVIALVGQFGASLGETQVTVDLRGVSVLILTLLLGMELVDKLQFRDELLLARDLQSELMPKVLPPFPGAELAAYNRIANTVGGDLYDFVPMPDGRLAVLFGDASGHGMTAGLVMALAQAAFRTQLRVDAAPAAVAETMNQILCRTGACRTGGGARQYFAGITLLLSPDGSYEAVVSGHPAVLKVAATGEIVGRVGAGSYPLGVKEQREWAVETGRLAPGETLLFHSDGLPEARREDGEELGDARVARVLLAHPGMPAASLVGGLRAELEQFMGRLAPDDDVSIAAIRWLGRAAGT